MMEKYVRPELEKIELNAEDAVLTSAGRGGCIIVSWTVTYEDAAGNQYTTNGQ